MNDFIFVKKRLLNGKESAGYLGIAISTFYNMVNQKLIPYITNPAKSNNRFWRCDIRDLNNWIENNKVEELEY